MTDKFIKIEDSYILPYSRDEIWAKLNDPDILATCIKGCAFVEHESPQQFDAVIRAQLGSIKKDFIIALKVDEAGAPASYTLSSKVSAGLFGTANGRARVTLDALDKNTTTLAYVATIRASGIINKTLPALQNAAHRRVTTFFNSFVEQISGTGSTK